MEAILRSMQQQAGNCARLTATLIRGILTVGIVTRLVLFLFCPLGCCSIPAGFFSFRHALSPPLAD